MAAQTQARDHLAVLTPLEDKSWVQIFCFHINAGRSAAEADRRTWVDMKLIHPRLRDFDGIEKDWDDRKDFHV